MQSQTGASNNIATRLQEELRQADETRIAGGIGRTVKARVPIGLMEAAKARTGIVSDEDLLKAALVHLVIEADQVSRNQGQ